MNNIKSDASEFQSNAAEQLKALLPTVLTWWAGTERWRETGGTLLSMFWVVNRWFCRLTAVLYLTERLRGLDQTLPRRGGGLGVVNGIGAGGAAPRAVAVLAQRTVFRAADGPRPRTRTGSDLLQVHVL